MASRLGPHITPRRLAAQLTLVVTWGAIWGLLAGVPDAVFATRELRGNPDQSVFPAFGELGRQGVAVLEKEWDRTPEARQGILRTLAEIPCAESTELLCRFALDNLLPERLRVTATVGVGRAIQQTSSVRPTLMRLAADEDPKVRHAAVAAISEAILPDSDRLLVATAEGGDEVARVTASAAYGLGHYHPSEESLSAVRRLAQHEEEHVWHAAISTLRDWASDSGVSTDYREKCVGALRKLAHSDDEVVRSRTRETFRTVGYEPYVLDDSIPWPEPSHSYLWSKQ